MGKNYIRKALTGGASNALDAIDGNLLSNGDVAIVTVGGTVYFYVLDHDNSSAESSPGIISPDRNYGTKRWVLQGFTGGTFSTITTHLICWAADYVFNKFDAAGSFYWRSNGIAGAGAPYTDLMTLSNAGSLWILDNCSALSFTDRTKYPESLQQAYDALASMTGKGGQVDHEKMDPFIKGIPSIDKMGKEIQTRDLGAVVSCQAVVIKDLIARIEKLEKI